MPIISAVGVIANNSVISGADLPVTEGENKFLASIVLSKLRQAVAAFSADGPSNGVGAFLKKFTLMLGELVAVDDDGISGLEEGATSSVKDVGVVEIHSEEEVTGVVMSRLLISW